MPSPPNKKRKYREIQEGSPSTSDTTSKPTSTMDVEVEDVGERSGQDLTTPQAAPSTTEQSTTAAETPTLSSNQPTWEGMEETVTSSDVTPAVDTTKHRSSPASSSSSDASPKSTSSSTDDTLTGEALDEEQRRRERNESYISTRTLTGSEASLPIPIPGQTVGTGARTKDTKRRVLTPSRMKGKTTAKEKSASKATTASTTSFPASTATAVRTTQATTYQSASEGVMYTQGPMPTLPPRPPSTGSSHQSAINTGRVTFTSPDGAEISFTLEPNDLQKLKNDAAAFDLSNLLLHLGSLESSQTTKKTVFDKGAELLPMSCRLQAAKGGSQQSAGSELAALPSFTLFQLERLLIRELLRGNQEAFLLISRLRVQADKVLLDLLKDIADVDNVSSDGDDDGVLGKELEKEKLKLNLAFNEETLHNDIHEKTSSTASTSKNTSKSRTGFTVRLKKAVSKLLSWKNIQRLK